MGYLSYEYANRVENTVPVAEKDELHLPLLYFMVTDLLLIFDHAHQSLTICANVSLGRILLKLMRMLARKFAIPVTACLLPLLFPLPPFRILGNQKFLWVTTRKKNSLNMLNKLKNM